MPDDVPYLLDGGGSAPLPALPSESGEAWGELLERFRAYLLLVANEELDTDLQAKLGASDLVQETLLEAHQDRSGFRGNTYGEFLGWLRQILLNNLANYRRHYQQTGKRRTAREFSLDADGSVSGFNVELVDDTTSPSGKAIRREEADALQGALDKLPDDYRQVLILRNREHLSFAEIGSRMNRSADAARMLWYRSFERLVGIMEQECRPIS
jgi:RNA polymerase sigma-70 factor (ECF subfamily)